MDDIQKIVEEIDRLNNKADQMRSMHSNIAQCFKGWQVAQNLFVTIGSAITAMLIFVQLPNFWFIAIGCFSASIFIVGLLPAAFDLSKKITERELALRLWGNWLRDAQNFRNITTNNVDIKEAFSIYDQLLKSYKEIMASTVCIPDKYFLKLKRKHKIKIAVSIELDKNPHESLRSLKKRLKKIKAM